MAMSAEARRINWRTGLRRLWLAWVVFWLTGAAVRALMNGGKASSSWIAACSRADADLRSACLDLTNQVVRTAQVNGLLQGALWAVLACLIAPLLLISIQRIGRWIAAGFRQ
jgi:hypothetical protein